MGATGGARPAAVAGERTQLLVGREDSSVSEHAASNMETALNLMKTCMGSGCLALPFACQQGGIVLFTFGSFAVAAWNVFSVQRLLACLEFIESDESSVKDEERSESSVVTASRVPPEGISVLGAVAWYAYGQWGVEALDIMMMILLLGVIVAYFCAILTFLAATPLSCGVFWNGLFTAIILTFISLVPHVGVLSHASALGLTVLLVTFLVIFAYGIIGYDDSSTAPMLELWPISAQGLSHVFGVVVFGYGIVPMTYNFRSSMRQPESLITVTTFAMGAVAASYCITGVGLYALFPALQGDILSELPTVGLLPILSRFAMVVVVLMTAPFVIVPCSELLEGKWQHKEIWKIRLGICALSSLVAVAFPDFVVALSLVGSTCVAAVSFCIPPLLHWRLHSMKYGQLTLSGALDLVMLALGIALTIIATMYNLKLL